MRLVKTYIDIVTAKGFNPMHAFTFQNWMRNSIPQNGIECIYKASKEFIEIADEYLKLH